MKVLFIKPAVAEAKNFKIKILNFYKDIFGFEDISAFFEASLRSAFKVKRMSAAEAVLKKEQVDKNFDFVVVDSRTDILAGANGKEENAIALSREFKIPKVLFVSTDKALVLPKDEVLDKYDIVFKREPFSDLDKYDILEENRKKIFTTMLACPFVRLSKFRCLNPILKLLYPKYEKNRKYRHDVYFSGPGAKEGRAIEDYKNRNKIWEIIKKEGFKAFGGIVPRNGEIVPKNIKSENLKGKKYREAINNSKICLAIDGVGGFTYRHLELFYLGAFVLSTDSLDELELPIKLEKGRDYVSFSSLDDMAEKIRYYLTHNEEREKIASFGREKFLKYYDTKKHGEYIKNRVENKLNGK